MFVGYSPTQQGYKCYNPITRKFIISCDVSFLETKPFFHHSNSYEPQETNWSTVITVPINSPPRSTTPTTADHPCPIQSLTSISPSKSHQGGEKEEIKIHQGDQDPNRPFKVYSRRTKPTDLQPTNLSDLEVSPNKPTDTTGVDIQQPLADELNIPIALRKGRRTCTKHPITNFLGYSKLSPCFKTFTLSLDNVEIPRNIYQALQDENWKNAIKEEITALEKNGAWEIVDLSEEKRAVGSKWVFTLKYKLDRSLERYKARPVTQGFTQTQGLDCEETFAPVAKLNSIRILLSLAVNLDWKFHQLDIKNAFLNGDLEEEIYMRIPPEFEKDYMKEKVCRLKKSLYGLKQSPRAWLKRFSDTLYQLGYKQGQANHTLFTKIGNDGRKTILIVYVDDIIITGDNQQEIEIKGATEAGF